MGVFVYIIPTAVQGNESRRKEIPEDTKIWTNKSKQEEHAADGNKRSKP